VPQLQIQHEALNQQDLRTIGKAIMLTTANYQPITFNPK
jgi:hypothetical protein